MQMQWAAHGLATTTYVAIGLTCGLAEGLSDSIDLSLDSLLLPVRDDSMGHAALDNKVTLLQFVHVENWSTCAI